jgi:hypothetical protein
VLSHAYGPAIHVFKPGTGRAMTGDRVSEIPQHLAPNGDHSDEQRQGGERGSFLNYGFEHEHLSRNKERT